MHSNDIALDLPLMLLVYMHPCYLYRPLCMVFSIFSNVHPSYFVLQDVLPTVTPNLLYGNLFFDSPVILLLDFFLVKLDVFEDISLYFLYAFFPNLIASNRCCLLPQLFLRMGTLSLLVLLLQLYMLNRMVIILLMLCCYVVCPMYC